jgi:L-alanine-DL-glutamate epimerase-like enolase superfamily enzyme
VARIERVTIHQLRVPFTRPFVTAVRTAFAVDGLLVQVHDSDGRSGWGEAPTSWRVTGESTASVTAAISGPLSEAIVGAPSDEPGAVSAALERAVVRNSSARMALDCAIYDLAARVRDIPLFQYLGGNSPLVTTDMTLSVGASSAQSNELVTTAREHANAGFATLKVKVGAHGDDVRTLRDVRDAVGPAVKLRADANQGWSAHEAVRIINALEDSGVDLELVEQPVDRDDLDGLAFVTAHVHTPIMADETVWSARDLGEIVRIHAADMINIKLAKTGGLRIARELAHLAKANGVEAIIGCMSESHVGIAAAAALAAALDAEVDEHRCHDLDGGLWLTHSPVVGGVSYDVDHVVLANDAGTGITGLNID